MSRNESKATESEIMVHIPILPIYVLVIKFVNFL